MLCVLCVWFLQLFQFCVFCFVFVSMPFHAVCQGNIEVTISAGRVVWANGMLNVTPGSGRFIPMAPFGPLFHGLDRLDRKEREGFAAPVVRASVEE